MHTQIPAATQQAHLETIQAAFAQRSWPDTLMHLTAAAQAAVKSNAHSGGTSLTALDALCADMATALAQDIPVTSRKIGFDKVTNIHVVTEIYQAGGHRNLIDQIITTLPDERHIVLFTGALSKTRSFSTEAVVKMGGFPLHPDPALDHFDCLLWLREKLATFAGQRLFLHHHPSDAIATVALSEFAPAYAERTYIVHHADTVPSLGVNFPFATHLAIRPEQKQQILDTAPDHSVHVIPLVFSPERLDPPITQTVADSILAEQKLFLQNGTLTTATCGGGHKFNGKGDLSLAQVLVRILRATLGRHYHIGPLSRKMKAEIDKTLTAAGIADDRVTFISETHSVAQTLVENAVDVFLTSFPVGGGLTIMEAAYAGIPIMAYDGATKDSDRYLSGLTHTPDDVMTWDTPDTLETTLRALWTTEPVANLERLSLSARDWFRTCGTLDKFSRRLKAIIAVTEGRHRAPIDNSIRTRVAKAFVDPAYYLNTHADVARAGVDPIKHFLSHGEVERRKCNPVFDGRFYLSQLTGHVLETARKAPLTHYVMRGEKAGYRPHPLFDPVFCKASLIAADAFQKATGDPLNDCILLQYLKASVHVAPHMFFDPNHYSRQAEMVAPGQSLLAHFLDFGSDEKLSPHPLIAASSLRNGTRSIADVLRIFLAQPKPREKEPVVTPLFQNDVFFDKDRMAAYENVAPNLLWAHLIEGNICGRNPHLFVSIDHIERMRPGTLVSATAAIEHLATNRLGVDTHPLIQGRHIAKQAPYAASLPISLTQYFLEKGAADNIDPNPFFSMQYYRGRYADLRKFKLSPLIHYLKHGQTENRVIHPAFDAEYYWHKFLKETSSADILKDNALLDYIVNGAAKFRKIKQSDDALSNIAQTTAQGLLESGGGRAAAKMLASAIHPETATPHPTLVTEARKLQIDAQDADETTEIYPAQKVNVGRPAVLSPGHIAPPIGTYDAPAATASLYTKATVVAGNDGFIAQSGSWVDFGLRGFAPDIMQLKENGAVVAASQDAVLIRRHASEETIASGIFAGGTYSHNYFHFLLEVLPRVLLASDIAPAGTPLLADEKMPKQHYQILRHYCPHNPILRLARHSTVQVGRLYVGSMPNTIQDAFGLDTPPADAVQFHPAVIKRIVAQARPPLPSGDGRRLFLQRRAKVRKLLNADDIQDQLATEGFEAVNCASLSFTDQVSLFSQASGGIVGQSGAHMANMLFAPAGTRVLALFSNAPGTNYYFLSLLGAMLGHEIINIAGWSIFGTAQGNRPRPHEDFNVPETLITPFFATPQINDVYPAKISEARALLDILYDSVAQADTLTGAWGLRSRPTPPAFEATLITARRQLGQVLPSLSDRQMRGLLEHKFFQDFAGNTRSGFFTIHDYDTGEQAHIQTLKNYFETLASTETPREGAATMLALAMLYRPAWTLPLIATLGQFDPDLQPTYLRWLTTPPYLFKQGDDQGYADFTHKLLLWINAHLEPNTQPEIATQVLKVAHQLDLGQLLLVDAPVRATLEARNALLEKVALQTPLPTRSNPRPEDLSQGRIRIGILCRTFAKGPDSEAVVAFFKSFDKTRYEIFAYSVGFRDRVVADDEDFDQIFDATIDHRRVLSSSPYDCREQIVADDLDVFLYANATTFGLRELERALYHRVAPVQITLNSHLPVSLGFPSFDYFLTGRSDNRAAEVKGENYLEEILHADGSVINYLNSFEPRETPSFDRASLGLSDDDIVLMNGGSSQKLRYECLKTMLRALQAVPKGKLLLAPYNPGWAARSQAFAFNRHLTEAAAEVGVSLERVIVMGELSVAEAEAAVSLADIYLSSFPHGGATMTHLALIYGTPPVVLRRSDTKSIDQFLVSSLGFKQMLANTPDAYVKLVAKLANNPVQLQKLAQKISTAAQKPVFVANPTFSREMQSALQKTLHKARQSRKK